MLASLQFAEGEDVILPGVLHATGHEPFQTVNVIGCHGEACAAGPDPRGTGLGAAGGD